MKGKRVELAPKKLDYGKEQGPRGERIDTEYGLREVMRELDAWLGDERPMLPIETAISARFWLYRLTRHCHEIADCISQPFTEEDLEKLCEKFAEEVAGK